MIAARIASAPRWLVTVSSTAAGAAVLRGAWAGRWYGIAAMALLLGVVFLSLDVAEAALGELEDGPR